MKGELVWRRMMMVKGRWGGEIVGVELKCID